VRRSEIRERVCAVVVTYNRKELLRRCLNAVLQQEYPVEGIVVVDNASADGTPEMLLELGYLRELPPKQLGQDWKHELIFGEDASTRLIYVRMPRNTGGAGGFNYGLKVAYEQGFDWFWLMDDDTMPDPSALRELLRALDVVEKHEVGFIASKAVWTDGSPHKLNLPDLSSTINGRPFNLLDANDLIVVRAATFVSILIPRHAVARLGYPIKEMFLWGDDTEFTMRLTSSGYLGLYAQRSIAVHLANNSADEVCNMKLYYGARNGFYISRKRGALRLAYFVLTQLNNLAKKPARCRGFILKGLMAGFLFNPKTELPPNESE